VATRRERLRRIVDSIVLSQGNDFIKELLREKGLPLGTKKEDFQRNLYTAIDEGKLSSDDVVRWVHAVEGWGAHHAYIFRADLKMLESQLWQQDGASQRLHAAGLADLLDKPRSFAFPSKLTATTARIDDTRVEINWHQGNEGWARARDKDRQEEIDGDQYYFEAYRYRAERVVVRLALRRDHRLCGVFIPLPLGPSHDDALREAGAVAEKLFGQSALRPINIAQAQLRLDTRLLEGDVPFRAARSRVTGGGGYVEFGSTIVDASYADVDAVRHVRRAVGAELTGDSAGLAFEISRGSGAPRLVRVDLNAAGRRIWIRAQLTEDEEWQILREIAP
jgi:hypothetical protein